MATHPIARFKEEMLFPVDGLGRPSGLIFFCGSIFCLSTNINRDYRVDCLTKQAIRMCQNYERWWLETLCEPLFV